MVIKRVPPATDPSNLSPHPRYYIRGADLHFLLGRTLFRVHSYFFLRESGYWQDQLAGATSPGDSPLKAGSSDTNAITLDEKPEDFERLLAIFYNPKYGVFDETTIEDWITILNYAAKWQFLEVKELAIRCLEQKEMDPIERLRLYQDHQVPQKHLFPLYVQLASREELLGLEESRALGLETLVLIHQARERLRAQPSEGKDRLLSPIRTDLRPVEIFDIVGSTFNIPVADREPSPLDINPSASASSAGGINRNSSGRTSGRKNKPS